MIKTIAHLADIHIRKTPTRNEEYQQVFDRTISSLKKEKPDRIVIVGDLVHDYLDLQGEQLIMAHNFLKELAKIAPVRITRGNHDCRKKNLKRVDSIKAIVATLGDADVLYYDKTDFYVDENVTWAVWHHGEKNNNPWKTKEGKKLLAYQGQDMRVNIDLFHDPITGCMSTTDFEMKSKSYYKISDFKGTYSLFGDIHRMQYLDKDKKKAYCGSLIEQDITEGDGAFHGYLLWDIIKQTTAEIEVPNNYSHHNIKVTPYIDFEDLDFEIENPTKYMWVRFVWGTLPQTRTNENERSLVQYVKSKYKNITISHKNEFIESEEIEVNENITLENVTDEAVQQEIFREFLIKTGAEEQLIADILALDEEVLNEIEIQDEQCIEWDVIKFGGNNFMSYEKLDIDWRQMDGIFQINGANTAGKTTIMKLISYLLFGKTLETETRIKFGDKRFVNNRNGAKSCDAYMVLEANGEYFGIKKITKIETTRDGSITKVPTTLSYYLLDNPDDEMTDDNALEKLDGDRRVQTQKKIESIIGSYDNFMRIVMTTSDTLNQNLSNDMAVFIDSLLYDSGLDIFDKKLEGLKVIQKRVNEKSRVVCNVEATTERIAEMRVEINSLKERIGTGENITLREIQGKIELGRKYLETLTKKLYKIDEEIYNLDVDEARLDISAHQKKIVEIKARKAVLTESINALRESYDEAKLNKLIEKRDAHKQEVYDKKLLIKEEERSKSDFQHRVEILNGQIFTLKRDGGKLKQEAIDLKNSKNCPQCGQVIDKKEHQDHIAKTVKEKEAEMVNIVKQIKEHEHDIDTDWKPVIKKCDENVVKINEEIDDLNLKMEKVLKDIGVLTNEKNDVERRKEFQAEYNLSPTKIQNEELNIGILEQKITRHENSLKQIEENRKIEKGIEAAKERITVLETEEQDEKENIFIWKTKISEYENTIVIYNTLIASFKEQEYQDLVMSTYKKCVHRDGIPRQMLSNHIIPKINLTLERILSVAPFKVWLDIDDLRPKLVYYDRPDSIIDCISASGKERTFSSVVLKFGLNQINVKAKPSIFLLDEVMGKLDENAIEEFKEILQLIKGKMKKVLVVEQLIEINPDYLIQVQLDDAGISSLTIE
jgi:DNA repair exonuclease SbcCD ATPase subunit